MPPRSPVPDFAARPTLASDASDAPERPELTPTWHILVPLVTVVVALVALALAPPLLTRHTAELRRELTEVLTPLSSKQTQYERSIASEAAAARGYALTEDPFFSDRFITVNDYIVLIEAQLDSLSALATSGEIVAAVDSLVAEHARWETVNFGLAPADFRERLPEHQRRYEAIMGAVQGLDQLIDQEIEAVRQQIRAADERRALVTIILAVIAILAAAGALWLAHRLRRSGQHLLRWAREEAALRRLAQTMAEAGDLPGALKRIVHLVATTTGADGTHIEQVDDELQEVEVVVTTGATGVETGARTAYEGSLAEQALTHRSAIEARRPPSHADVEARSTGPTSDQHLLVVPLLSEGEALGVLQLTRAQQPFTLSEVQRTRLLADMAALVLRRLHLFAEVRAKEQALAATAAELRRLNETLEVRVRDRTQRVQELSRALTLAEQRERRELAQVLHDDLQQILYGLQLGLRTLELRTPELDAPALQSQLRDTHDLAGEAIDATRRLTVDLSPPVLASDGLGEAFEWLATHVEERFGLNVTVEAHDRLSPLSNDMHVLLFQTVRELLFNVVKHADTERATLALCERDGVLRIDVVDEGVGFDSSSLPAGAQSTLGGFGLRRARERLALFDGCVLLDSTPGRGTRATVTVPVERLQAF